MAEQWIQLEDDLITTEDVQNLLGQVSDDYWIAAACVDRVVNNTAVQNSLLRLGIARTEKVVDRCKDIIALCSSSQTNDQEEISPGGPLLSHFTNTPADAQLCYLRSVLLRRLDRLNTYVDMEAEFAKGEEGDKVDEVMDEWEDDPWADGNDTAGSSKATPSSKSTEPPPISLAEFLQNDLVWSACELASLSAVQALQILFNKHSEALWPARFRILQCIPDYTYPSICRDIFPALDSTTNMEAQESSEPWRQQLDFVELTETQDALKQLEGSLPSITDSAKMVRYEPCRELLPPEELSTWYKNRVSSVVSLTGMIDVALALVQHGAAQGIPSLDELGEELSLLSRLVYDASQGSDIQDDWTLVRWSSMDPMAVVKAYLAHSPPTSLPRDISRLVMPYLYVLEARAERAGQPDPSLPTRLLHDYILDTSLDNAAAIFEASKPTLPAAQRIIKNDEDMARLALACLYGSTSLDEWATMSSIFECLPAWEISKDADLDEDTADTTVASLGAFVTPSTNQPQVTAKDLIVFFKPLPFASLSQALDILDVHLESGEILARWGVPAPLRWFLQSSEDIQEQRKWANRMARKAGGKDRMDGIEDWEWLLKDMLKLTGGGDLSARGALCLLSSEEVTTTFLSGLLTSGNFAIAKKMLSGTHSKISLSLEQIESVALTCSRELYDNSSSGNYKFGDMKLAYECLDVPQSTPALTKEKEFIEATSRISSFNVFSSPGTPISPIEIRLTKDRLSLVSQVLSSNSDAYKHTEVILELCYKLGYREDSVAEVKVLAMLADAALQAEDFTRAYENSERMVQTVASLRNSSPLELDDEKAREASEVCWIACFQLGRQSEFDDLSKRATLLGHAVELCPPEKIHDVLTAWRKLEKEDIEAREEKLRQRQNGQQLGPVAARKIESGPSNVASSLRARLQDFHMPSPPLLSTPDAAALASRTFKSVTSNFPFSVHRPRSEMDERISTRSDGSRRTDLDEVSSQASRVLSKGIGWLIGADEQ
ncbi:secretory pathway protein Sec39-domain-containing protein [Crepidotus variabilis]|uniref:Secretory pathway protein Sec39-domain-containing protein n=1 Tax=Crepidotus variabilis TaxID=179855 RepID=A0A9P6EE63_9AGAR|nr:secretory pathway protein Sec39-domain-containing protein [Crepidotus variabilis]